MYSVFLRFTLFFLLLGLYHNVWAQSTFERKLDSLKEKDNLEAWILERLDHVSSNPQQRFSYLMDTQKMLWRNPKTYNEHYIFLDLINSQGYYQLLDGNILGSINSYEKAYNYYLKNKISSYEIVEYTLKPLSNNYTRIGDYERAIYLLQTSVKFLIKNNDAPEAIASLYSNIAISYRSMGNFKDAEKNIWAGLKLAKPDTRTNLTLNNILADILVDKGDYLAAAKLVENTITKQRKLNAENAYSLMGSYTTAGLAYFKLKNAKKADDRLTKALHIINSYFKGDRLREKANIQILRGRVKLLQHQYLLAINDFNQTLYTLKVADKEGNPTISKIYGDYRLVEVFEQMADAYLALKKPDEAFNAIKLALFSADKIRNEFVDDQTKQRLQADLKHTSEKAIEIGYQLYKQTQNKNILDRILELAEQSKARTLLDQINNNQRLFAVNQKDSLFIKKQAFERAITYNEKQELENKSNTINKNTDSLKFYLSLVNNQIKQKYKQLNLSRDISFSTLMNTLPNKRIIEYFVGRDAIYLIDINNKKVNDVIKIEDAAKITTAIQSYTTVYFQQGPNAMLNDPKAFYQTSYQLYQSILKNVKFVKGQSVIIVPDGALGYISFDGLITEDNYKPNIANWPFLIKNNSITYAFSLKTLTSTKTATHIQNFTGLFITHQKNSNKPLKAVADEAEAIKKTVNGDFLLNDQVNSHSFNEAFEKSSVLHIGTHAYLSGKNQEPTLDFDKEKLFLFELAAKKQAPALVVLSACRTADGLLANGEGVISLSRGFNAIGTPATIAGLWNVNDVAASVITGNFYKHMLAGESNGNALHMAKIDWLNAPQTADAFYLPYYWDSLIYMGTDQQLTLKAATNWVLMLGIGTAVILFFGALVLIKLRKSVKRKIV